MWQKQELPSSNFCSEIQVQDWCAFRIRTLATNQGKLSFLSKKTEWFHTSDLNPFHVNTRHTPTYCVTGPFFATKTEVNTKPAYHSTQTKADNLLCPFFLKVKLMKRWIHQNNRLFRSNTSYEIGNVSTPAWELIVLRCVLQSALFCEVQMVLVYECYKTPEWWSWGIKHLRERIQSSTADHHHAPKPFQNPVFLDNETFQLRIDAVALLGFIIFVTSTKQWLPWKWSWRFAPLCTDVLLWWPTINYQRYDMWNCNDKGSNNGFRKIPWATITTIYNVFVIWITLREFAKHVILYTE